MLSTDTAPELSRLSVANVWAWVMELVPEIALICHEPDPASTCIGVDDSENRVAR